MTLGQAGAALVAGGPADPQHRPGRGVRGRRGLCPAVPDRWGGAAVAVRGGQPAAPAAVGDGVGPDEQRVWEWKDELPRKGLAWSGRRLHGGQASFLCADLLADCHPHAGAPTTSARHPERGGPTGRRDAAGQRPTAGGGDLADVRYHRSALRLLAPGAALCLPSLVDLGRLVTPGQPGPRRPAIAALEVHIEAEIAPFAAAADRLGEVIGSVASPPR
jgi:hypothetical protein